MKNCFYRITFIIKVLFYFEFSEKKIFIEKYFSLFIENEENINHFEKFNLQ